MHGGRGGSARGIPLKLQCSIVHTYKCEYNRFSANTYGCNLYVGKKIVIIRIP